MLIILGFIAGVLVGYYCSPTKVVTRFSPNPDHYQTAEVECFICTYRWVAVCKQGTDLRRLECPLCHSQDSVVT